MEYSTSNPWRADFELAAPIARAGRSTEFYRAVRTGRYRRVAHGVYLPATTWVALTADQRFLAVVHAAALASRPGILFSHQSAAALWQLPMVGRWPLKAEVLTGPGSGGRSRKVFVAHGGELPDNSVSIDGLAATSLAATVIDVGRTTQLVTSVAMADRALAAKPRMANGVAAARVTPDELWAALADLSSSRGVARCGRMLDLSDGLSGSAGESLSRVQMHLLGLPRPVLQQEFRDARGLIGFTDFWWPEFNLIGEFDGHGKYRREEYLNGMSPADAVIAEKKREDRLRATGARVTRWGWETARSMSALGAHLASAGLC